MYIIRLLNEMIISHLSSSTSQLCKHAEPTLVLKHPPKSTGNDLTHVPIPRIHTPLTPLRPAPPQHTLTHLGPETALARNTQRRQRRQRPERENPLRSQNTVDNPVSLVEGARVDGRGCQS